MLINGKEYVINRATVKVTEFDKIYCSTIKEIINHGELCENRTGIDTLSIPNVNFTLDVEKEFPILETKKVFVDKALTELMWIYQAKSNRVKWLHERNNHIWDEWMIDEDGILRTYEPFGNEEPDKEINVVDLYGNIIIGLKAKSKIEGKTIKSAKFFGLEYAGTIGTCYGGQLAITDEFDKNVLTKLKNNPNDRRKNVNLLQDQFMITAALPTCVWASTYKVYRNRLYLDVSVRSNDMPAGNPFNITQYAELQNIVAKVSNFGVGKLDWHISDCHIYLNQIKQMKQQLERYEILLKWEKFIKENSDEEIELIYKDLLRQKNIIDEKIKTKRFEESYVPIKGETDINVLALEHLLTRQNPYIEIADNKGFYDLDNSEKNKDIKIKNYTSLPYIKIPIAQ